VRRGLPARHDLLPDGPLRQQYGALQRAPLVLGPVVFGPVVFAPVPGLRPRVNAPEAGLRTRHDPRAWLRLLLDD
jgi:hypothetical protein